MLISSTTLNKVKEGAAWAALGYGVGSGAALVLLILVSMFLGYVFGSAISLTTVALASLVVGLASSAAFTVLWFFVLFDSDPHCPTRVDKSY